MTKNTRTLICILAVVGVMAGMAFAAVPLYTLFCKMTGFGGTTQVAQRAPDTVLAREMTVRFNTDTSPGLPWSFRPDQRQMKLHIGQEGLISFVARNESGSPVAGTALYNVTPAKAGKYFQKIQCFCFDAQILTPGQEMHMPVVFFIDPALAADKDLDDVGTITLSYTFFPADSEALDAALEDFYNADGGQDPAPTISN